MCIDHKRGGESIVSDKGKKGKKEGKPANPTEVKKPEGGGEQKK